MARTLKQQIRKTIKQHYGDALWSFRADVNYGAATESFVNAISKVLKGEIEYCRDWQCDLAKYEKAGPLEIEIGKRLRDIRLRKEMTLEEVAARMKVRPSYLDDLEQGIIAGDLGTLIAAHRSLKASREDKAYVVEAFTKEMPVEERIKDVINLYYGRNLWTLRPQYEYEESIAPFVQALAGLDQTGRRSVVSAPTMPSLGDMIELEERRRGITPDSVYTGVIQEKLEAHST